LIWHNIHHVWYVGDKLNYRLLNLIIYFFQLGCIPKDNRTLSLSQCLNEHNNLETWNVNTISLINCSVWSTSSNQSIQITFQWVHTAKSPQWQTKWKKILPMVWTTTLSFKITVYNNLQSTTYNFKPTYGIIDLSYL
jgi:hypothetical protein